MPLIITINHTTFSLVLPSPINTLYAKSDTIIILRNIGWLFFSLILSSYWEGTGNISPCGNIHLQTLLEFQDANAAQYSFICSRSQCGIRNIWLSPKCLMLASFLVSYYQTIVIASPEHPRKYRLR